MKIERIEISAYKNRIYYTFMRYFNGIDEKYKVWIYNANAKNGKEFSISRNSFFKNIAMLHKEKAIIHYTICTENGFAMVYPLTNKIHYEKYDFFDELECGYYD